MRAYLTLRTARAGVAAPEIVEAGTAGPSRDALLASRLPSGTALADADADADAAQISDAMHDDLYRQLLSVRKARIVHGAISGDTLLADGGAGNQAILSATETGTWRIRSHIRLPRSIESDNNRSERPKHLSTSRYSSCQQDVSEMAAGAAPLS